MILYHFPIIENNSFKSAFDRISLMNDQNDFHIRMITVSFLTKHLLIDWRWGEAYFASKLLDHDFARKRAFEVYRNSRK